MKNLFNTILLLLVSSIMYSQNYDTLITPISVNALQDASISSDVFFILNGKADENLYAFSRYGRWNKKHSLGMSSDNSEFYLGFSESLQKTKEKRIYQTSCSDSLPFITHLHYIAHGKGGPALTTNALSVINQEIISVFSGQSIRCIVKSYKSKDRFKDYCHLYLESGSKKLEYIFIIKNYHHFYKCVVRKSI